MARRLLSSAPWLVTRLRKRKHAGGGAHAQTACRSSELPVTVPPLPTTGTPYSSQVTTTTSPDGGGMMMSGGGLVAAPLDVMLTSAPRCPVAA
jgi:hypothetical protein